MRVDNPIRVKCQQQHLARRLSFVFASLTLAVITGCARSRVTVVDDATLSAADSDAANWLTYGRTYSEQRFSPLKQIDEQTVSRLGLTWSYDLATLRGLEATPLVQDGVMYTSSAWSLVYAFDASTGKLLWQYDPHVAKDHAKFVCCDVVNRGVALYRGRVYVGTLDGRLIALDARTGMPVWDVQTTPKDGPYAITGAPRIAKGRVFIGNAGSEYAVRGYVSAYDADTGKLIWRTYTVPGDPSQPFESEAMRKAAATWSGEWWKAGGGGTVWDTMVYDPETDFVFFGTGNGSPWYDRLRSKGDNLYIASIVALRADTGEQVWAYQTTPGDNWDYDATQPLMLATLAIDGQQRRVLMQANKNGFFYELDPATGKLISAKPYAEMNWATGIDANGRPIENAEVRALKDATIVKPSSAGAHNWYPLSFNPATGLVYMATLDATTIQAVTANWKINMHDQTTGLDRGYIGPVRKQWLAFKPAGKLVAWNPATQTEAWHVDLPDPGSGGTLSTAGDLVFQGRADGKLIAYRATDGKAIWEFDAGIGIMAPPMTYEAGGKQYIAVLAGWGGPEVLGNRATGKGKVGPGKLLAFALDGKATLPPYEHVDKPVPTPTFQLAASRADVEKGRILYATFCARCHGGDVVSGGEVPDLRYATEGTHQKFQEIVRGGALRELGMPSFAEDVTAEQVRLIESYVLQRERETARVESSSR
ncbi:MAG TPA: PQQ-dependent dehydrogenase, methanol/ethanol family [Candidatus Acidoferrales bacterium]|jgi:quinohemoprotein ethanol dehydrogenase|nr:PQQ-dependent dehydrogenase, methanol/ethanol family [Candidatus Acidoferrales bacterium]